MSLPFNPTIPNVPGILPHQSAVYVGFSTITAANFWAPASGGGGGGGNQTIDTLTINNEIIFNDSLGGSEFSEMIKKGTETAINYDPNATGLETFAINGSSVSNMVCSSLETNMTGVPIVLIQDLSGVQTINALPYVPSGVTSFSATASVGGTVVNPNTTLQNLVMFTLPTALLPNTAYLFTVPYSITVASAAPNGTYSISFLFSEATSTTISEPIIYPGVSSYTYEGTLSGIIVTSGVATTQLQIGIQNNANATTLTCSSSVAPGVLGYYKQL